jgi:hypothetical protein
MGKVMTTGRINETNAKGMRVKGIKIMVQKKEDEG